MIHSSLYLTKKHKATKGFPTKDIRKHTALPFWNPSLKRLGGHMKRNYNDDLLSFLLEYSKISIEDAKSEIEKMTNRKYLEQHSLTFGKVRTLVGVHISPTIQRRIKGGSLQKVQKKRLKLK